MALAILPKPTDQIPGDVFQAALRTAGETMIALSKDARARALPPMAQDLLPYCFMRCAIRLMVTGGHSVSAIVESAQACAEAMRDMG